MDQDIYPCHSIMYLAFKRYKGLAFEFLTLFYTELQVI